jgi:hypothetical protein
MVAPQKSQLSFSKLETEIEKFTMLPSTLLALQSDGHLEKITEVLFSV